MTKKDKTLMTVAVILLSVSNGILNLALWFANKAGVRVRITRTATRLDEKEKL